VSFLSVWPRPSASKVPEIDGWFWGVKLLTTAFGEAAADYFALRFNPYLAVVSVGVVFVVALWIQVRTSRYHPGTYWFAAAMVACFGTMVADAVHVQFDVPYWASTVALVVILTAVFIVWHRVEHTLSIHSITTRRREMFYWMAIISTFALGTAAGDLTASIGGMGYFVAAMVFTVAILIPAVVFAVTRRHAIGWFWAAYVLTRPLGASFADWFSKSPSVHGLGYGDGPVAVVLGVAIVIVLAVMTWQQSRSRRPQRAAA